MKGRSGFEALVCDGVAHAGIRCAWQLSVGDRGVWGIADMFRCELSLYV